MTKEGLLLVLSGPSGSGKGTVLNDFLKENPDVFLSVSATTRCPREGEEEGKHYYFLSKREFEELVQNDGMLEYAEYCGNFYGTPRKKIFEKLQAGNDVFLEIEVQGAMQVKKSFPQAILVFVIPPTLRELGKRLIGRGTESDDIVNKRMATAIEEIKLAYNYDYIIVNDTVEKAISSVTNILLAEKCSLKRNRKLIDEVLRNA